MASDPKPPEEEPEHTIVAFYAGGPGEPYYQPVLECGCGFSTNRCESWEEAGQLYDMHRRLIGEVS
jgi:hypothetical protein